MLREIKRKPLGNHPSHGDAGNMGTGDLTGTEPTSKVVGKKLGRIRARRFIRLTTPTRIPTGDTVVTRKLRNTSVPVVETAT
jgi:hypothetical protein